MLSSQLLNLKADFYSIFLSKAHVPFFILHKVYLQRLYKGLMLSSQLLNLSY